MQTELERLQEFISSKGWSKSDFAGQMDIQKQNVSKYLSGALKIDGLYGKLMDNGCDIHWLRTGERLESSEQMLSMLQKMGITSPEQLQKFLDVEDIVKDVQQAVYNTLRNRRKQR